VLGLSWTLNLPGFVQLLRLPGLNLMSHNRLCFATAFALLALAGTGLEALAQGQVEPRRGWWAPAGLLGALCAWCLVRTMVPPEVLETKLPQLVAQGKKADWIRDLADVRLLQAWFTQSYFIAAAWCALGLAGWWWLWSRRRTNYLLPVGNGAVFEPDKSIMFKDITDGSSNTIMVVTVDDAHAAIWTKPDDWPFDPQHPTAGLGHFFKRGFATAFCDGSVHTLAWPEKPKDLARLRALFTRASGETIDW